MKFAKGPNQASLLNEQNALKQCIGKPNIIQLLGFGVDDGTNEKVPEDFKNQPFLIVELATGGDISEIVGSSKRFTQETKMQAVIECTRGRGAA